MGESQGEEKGLDRTPCSLANAQKAFWGGGGNLDWRRKKRRKKSDSRQVRKNDSALKRRKQYCQKPESSRKKEEYGKIATLSFTNTSHSHFAVYKTTHTQSLNTATHTSSSGDLGVSPSGEGFTSDSGEALAKVG